MRNKSLDSIADYVREGYDLRVECRSCRKITFLSAAEMQARLNKQRRPLNVELVEVRLRCTCGKKEAKLGPSLKMMR